MGLRNRRIGIGIGLSAVLILLSILPTASNDRPGARPVTLEPPTTIPLPPAGLPPGATPHVGALPDLPPVGNRVKPLPPQAVDALAKDGISVIENEDGLIAVDTTDGEGNRIRIAVLNEKTDEGTEVMGLAFLDEADIAQLEDMEAQHESGAFGPQVASAHFKDQSHYHYFYSCSWVYNQGGTYGISTYMCPNDTWADRALGDAVGTALACCAGHPLLRALGGFLVWANHWVAYRSDGSLYASISDYRQLCGWVFWNGAPAQWMYYYCQGSSNFGYAWSDGVDQFFDVYP